MYFPGCLKPDYFIYKKVKKVLTYLYNNDTINKIKKKGCFFYEKDCYNYFANIHTNKYESICVIAGFWERIEKN